MAAATYNFIIEQGATFIRSMQWTNDAGSPIDMTGYSARLKARPTTTSGCLLLDMTTSNGQIVISPASSGCILWQLSATETAALNYFKNAPYDFEVESSGSVVYRLLQGVVTLSLEVTR